MLQLLCSGMRTKGRHLELQGAKKQQLYPKFLSEADCNWLFSRSLVGSGRHTMGSGSSAAHITENRAACTE